MSYLEIYLITVIVLAIVLGLIVAHDESKEAFKGFLVGAVAVIFWPVTIIALPIVILSIKRQEAFDQNVENAYERLALSTTYEHNSEKIREAKTADLKLLIKGARSGKISLKAVNIEIIKRELVDRATENGLLK